MKDIVIVGRGNPKDVRLAQAIKEAEKERGLIIVEGDEPTEPSDFMKYEIITEHKFEYLSGKEKRRKRRKSERKNK